MEEPRFFRFLTAKRFLMEAPAFPKVGMGRAASGGAEMFFGAARMFTASLAVAKPPPSRSWAGRARSRAGRPGGAAGGRFAPCPLGRGWTFRFDGRLGRRAEALASLAVRRAVGGDGSVYWATGGGRKAPSQRECH